MEKHRLVSGCWRGLWSLGGEDVDIYRTILGELQAVPKIDTKGVAYDPYHALEVQGRVLALLKTGKLSNKLTQVTL